MKASKRLKRRDFIAVLAALGAVPLQAANAGASFAGICTFSCNLHWQAVRSKTDGTAFHDVLSFYDYVRKLGADGMQTSFRDLDTEALKALRSKCESDLSYLEGDIRFPKSKTELDVFEHEVKATRETGATVARAVLMGGRRYEVFRTQEEFRQFYREAKQRLELVEPILAKNRLNLAVENHKDFTLDEQIGLLKGISSEWIGALVDTGNNIALLDEPHSVVEQLAPYAMSVHLKDMAVQPYTDGFLLSEVPCGTGFLDLQRMISVLRKANPVIVFNLEMATRDPLKVPCLTDAYWSTFPDRKATHLDAAMKQVDRNPRKQPTPTIYGKPLDRQLADEEANNRTSLVWMQKHLST
ncbi:MAG: TIM barrel protein [Pirellulaceae bacterium]|nr:TIM barrel protein [Pirellulaceae bacterium]